MDDRPDGVGLLVPSRHLVQIGECGRAEASAEPESVALPPALAMPEPPPVPPERRGRAAEYVRMSTEHQQYSTANQRDAIAAYARDHGMEIVRSYADEGKSGLSLRGREGLREMLADVIGGRADFGTILVYDVSRWGRFQDPDESAYYEFVCRKEGVHVEYCAEPFRNDGSATSSLFKSIKRLMAGEFSRELSLKVFVGKCRLARLGVRTGGAAGYGMRRLVLDASGRRRGFLEVGQQKFMQTDRVVLVPGPAKECAVIRWMFRQVAMRGQGPELIARGLNRRGVRSRAGRRWSAQMVRFILTNEKYMGTAVYNKSSAKLRGRRVRNPPDQWIRVENAYQPVVDPAMYRRAQAVLEKGAMRVDDQTALVRLRGLLDRKGKLTAALIDAEPGMPGCDFYRFHFGGLDKAYARVGYRRARDLTFLEGFGERERLLGGFRGRVAEQLRARGVNVERESGVVMVLNGRLRLGVLLARFKAWNGLPRWLAQIHARPHPDWLLIARLEIESLVIKDYCLVAGGLQGVWLGASHRQGRCSEWYEAELEPLIGWLARLAPARDSRGARFHSAAAVGRRPSR